MQDPELNGLLLIELLKLKAAEAIPVIREAFAPTASTSRWPAAGATSAQVEARRREPDDPPDQKRGGRLAGEVPRTERGGRPDAQIHRPVHASVRAAAHDRATERSRPQSAASDRSRPGGRTARDAEARPRAAIASQWTGALLNDGGTRMRLTPLLAAVAITACVAFTACPTAVVNAADATRRGGRLRPALQRQGPHRLGAGQRRRPRRSRSGTA